MIGVPPQDAVWSDPPSAVAVSASVKFPVRWLNEMGWALPTFRSPTFLEVISVSSSPSVGGGRIVRPTIVHPFGSVLGVCEVVVGGGEWRFRDLGERRGHHIGRLGESNLELSAIVDVSVAVQIYAHILIVNQEGGEEDIRRIFLISSSSAGECGGSSSAMLVGRIVVSSKPSVILSSGVLVGSN